MYYHKGHYLLQEKTKLYLNYITVYLGDECVDCFEFLLQFISMNELHDKGFQVLHKASSLGRIEITKVLLKFGVDQDMVDAYGR